MYARAKANPHKRTAQTKDWAAPLGGWVANRNLAQPLQAGEAQGAAVLDNWFVTSSSIIQRRGKSLYATLGLGDLDVTSLFTYVLGSNQKLFGATKDTIYDITHIVSADNWHLVTDTGADVVTDHGDLIGDTSTQDKLEAYGGNLTGDGWVVVQFTTSGGTYLIGVNGADNGFLYNGEEFYPIVPGGVWKLSFTGRTAPFTRGATLTGTGGATAVIYDIVDSGSGAGDLLVKSIKGTFATGAATDSSGGAANISSAASNVVPGISFPAGTTLTTADLSYVWAYQSRLFFTQKETLSAWYLPVDSVGGELTSLPVGGDFGLGGTLLFGTSWSLDSGNAGGLSEQCVFITNEGEVSAWQGNNPGDANSWSRVGVYRMGRPLGHEAHIRAGGDLVTATSIGFVPLSVAIQRDVAAISPAAVSYPIEDAWNEAVLERGMTGWNCVTWPERQMVCVSPPLKEGGTPVVFVSNARTGKWSRYTGWHFLCATTFQGQLYFGSPAGQVFLAEVTGADDGDPYTSTYIPLFDDLGSSASLKVGQMGWATIRGLANLVPSLSLHTNFDISPTPPPDAVAVMDGNQWDVGIWDKSTWGDTNQPIFNQKWQSVNGLGYVMALGVQVTSGSKMPLDAELIRSGITYQTSEIIT